MVGIGKDCHQSCETPSLMDYIKEYHVDVLDWQCDSVECESDRKLEREAGQETIRGPKPIKLEFVILQPPKILCIHLKRIGFDYCTDTAYKVFDDVHYPEMLNLSMFTDSQRPLLYRLYGVVAHHGKEIVPGHYIAAVRGRNADSAFALNDTNIETSDWDVWHTLRWPSFNGVELDPVMLFYIKV